MNYYNYFTEIEETFIRRRGKNLLLSPLDWALIESWQEREVPLHIVLRGIEKVFDLVDQQPARKRSVKSLFYCKEEIEAQFSEWLESRVGANGAAEPAGTEAIDGEDAPAKGELFSAPAIDAHLRSAGDALRSAHGRAAGELAEALERVLARLTELENAGLVPEKLEDALEKLDALLDESLLQTDAAARLKPEIEKHLAGYRAKMEKDVFARTFDLMLLKRLREQAEIPRLSLFYL
ncbi:MAG: hypothetical protein JSS81_17385 [Acidobacteria bacterium]|nr:hypothetical protein [Acidobacteriota bacterium]